MRYLTCQAEDGVALVKMARPKANALNDAMMAELQTAFDSAVVDPAVRAVVLASDCPRFFCAGFDAAEVFAYEREVMRAFFGRFIDLYELLIWFPKPLIASITGHAMAGGAVLALTADVRVMAEGPHGFALNEVNLGVVLPPGIVRMAIQSVGARCAGELLLSGKSIAPPEALRIGLALELAREEAVIPSALRIAKELAGKPAHAFSGIKRMLRSQAGFPEQGSDREWLEPFLDHWFSTESVDARNALLRRLETRAV